jgi:hypothetical protein
VIPYHKKVDSRNLPVATEIPFLDQHKVIYDAALLNENYADMHYLAIQMVESPVYLALETITLVCDFQGQEIHEISLSNAQREWINFTVTGNGVIILSWLGQNAAGDHLIRSLQAIPGDQKLDAITRFTCTCGKNLYFATAWWDTLTTDQQHAIAMRQAGVALLGYPPAPTCLVLQPYLNKASGTTLDMEAFGARLMAASPVRPGQHLLGVRDR